MPASLSVVVLAPHPDDFDAIAVSMRHLHRSGHAIHVAILTSGASGVDDGFEGAFDDATKAGVREAEQRASLRLFGLPDERLTFLRLWEQENAACRERLRAYLSAMRPHIVFMPHGNDSNATHRRTWETFCSIAEQDRLDVCACLNRDAKTVDMRVDLLMPYDAQAAAWKRELLRMHRSQQARNQRTRGHGFDERVLSVDRAAASALGLSEPFAETFELRFFARSHETLHKAQRAAAAR